MDINSYLTEIRSLAATGQATEHSYRPALERLFKSIDDNLTVINEPKQSAVGAPDFVFARNGVSVGWCEAKDLNKDITKFKTGDYGREQKERYKKGLPNLIKRPYLTVELCRSVLADPIRRFVQEDGRIRHWGPILLPNETEKRILRVVTLDDGQTLHNAFIDRNYREDTP